MKEIATKVGNTFLLNQLSMGDLKTNELYYHHCCYTEMVRECEAIEMDTSKIDTKWIKAATFDNILSHIIDAESRIQVQPSVKGNLILCM